jgi:predicted  nucleic acid-binding Zn-ribbon protein
MISDYADEFKILDAEIAKLKAELDATREREERLKLQLARAIESINDLQTKLSSATEYARNLQT